MASALFFLSNPLRGASLRRPNSFPAWLPILLFIGVIAIESTPTFGSNHTSGPLHRLFNLVLGTALDSHWPFIHHILRKTGHFTGYGFLSLLCYRGFSLTLRSVTHLHSLIANLAPTHAVRHALAIAVVFLVAGADEFHQTFLPNRTGCFSDVLLDTAGAAAAQLTLYLILNAADHISTTRLSKSALREISMWQPHQISYAELSA
ncbi:MAG TPA: VanZ family protein [Acidobacteriaceae bacterium]|jgi:VanZ family protein|nr:VanZ family protein [Acidobacteriaceae bacterium]